MKAKGQIPIYLFFAIMEKLYKSAFHFRTEDKKSSLIRIKQRKFKFTKCQETENRISQT